MTSTNEPSPDLQDCIDSAVESLNEHLDSDDDPWNGDENAMVHELADSACPIYNADILRIAAEKPEIGLTAPEHPAYSGEASPINCAQANIYTAIEETLWACLEERKAEAA